MGHFDILLFQTPQDLLETALGAGAFWAKTDPFTASVGPEGAWYQVKVCGDHVSNLFLWKGPSNFRVQKGIKKFSIWLVAELIRLTWREILDDIS